MAGKPILGIIFRAMAELNRPASADDIATQAGLIPSQVTNSLANHIHTEGDRAEVHRASRGVYAMGPEVRTATRKPTPATKPAPKPTYKTGRVSTAPVTIGEMAEIIGTTKNGVMFRTESGKLYDGRAL
jgi:hypothetical protein